MPTERELTPEQHKTLEKKFRVIRRVMMLVALLLLIVLAAAYGVIVGVALVAAFVCGSAFVVLNYLEGEAREQREAKEQQP